MQIHDTLIVEKNWGFEEHLTNGNLYCGKILVVNKGKYCSLHMHVKKTEDFYILRGAIQLEYQEGRFTEDGKLEGIGEIQKIILTKGKVVKVTPYMLHRFTGLEDVNKIIEISTQHFDEDSYRLELSCSK